MKKFEIEFAKFVTVEIEANSEEDANEKAAIMEDEDIEYECIDSKTQGYMIWNEARPINLAEVENE